MTDRLLILTDSNAIASINRINTTSDLFYKKIEQSLYNDPITSYKASVWFPRAQQVHKFINNLISNIEMFQKNSAKNTNELITEITVFKDSLLKIDPLITEYFKSEINAFPNSYDSSDKQSEEFMKSHLSELYTNQYNLYFNQLKLQLTLLENNLVKFCAEQIPKGVIIDEFYSVIISQNSLIIPPGKELKITTGIGSFKHMSKETVFIGGKNIDINEDGTVNYQMTVPKKEGKYSLPIKVQFFDQEDKQQTFEKKVEYQVKN